METFDYTIIGGGIFGAYAALYLSRQKYSICLLDKEDELFKKASIVNQARLHSGYHYPRSMETAVLANEYKERFIREHANFINFKFNQYYGIDSSSSYTDSLQFERFCQYLNIKAEKTKHDWIDFSFVDSLYLTEEFSFDPIMIAEYYKNALKNEARIELKVSNQVLSAEKMNGYWLIEIQDKNNRILKIKSFNVINATYAGTNFINNLFGLQKLNLVHEITELVFLSVPELLEFGITIMDGHFCSMMPYGLSGLHSLSSVTYTVHSISNAPEPSFNCQEKNRECQPGRISICNNCFAKPHSNESKMINQLKKYLQKSLNLNYLFSMFTIKTKLKASYIDDGRPTIVTKLHSNPDFFCLFAGKINSIYEIERIL